MLKKRIIPCLDVDQGRVVKGVNFTDIRDAGDPVEQAQIYDAQGADEICFLDITATHEGRKTMAETVAAVAGTVFIPLTVGGGISTLDDIRILLNAGADKVAINSAAVKNPDFIDEAAAHCGSQCIVVAIDAKYHADSQSWHVYTCGGREASDRDAVEWAREAAGRGAGEILLTSMDCDGTENGFDIKLTRAVTDAVTIPVIASGGVGNLHHFTEGIRDGGADAVLAASVFHFGRYTIRQVKDELAAADIPVRPVSAPSTPHTGQGDVQQ